MLIRGLRPRRVSRLRAEKIRITPLVAEGWVRKPNSCLGRVKKRTTSSSAGPMVAGGKVRRDCPFHFAQRFL